MSAHPYLSLIVPAKGADEAFRGNLERVIAFLDRSIDRPFEVIVVPNGTPGDRAEVQAALAGIIHAGLRSVPHFEPAGKGAAVRTGILHSRGQWVFFTDSDFPYSLDFIVNALRGLEAGADLVSGNRRLPQSLFTVAVPCLPLVFKRHSLGLAFNKLTRMMFRVGTTDTQAGIKGLSRRLAETFAGAQACPGFLFDIEIFLTAVRHGMKTAELPVSFTLREEKTTVRIFRESLRILEWLPRMKWYDWRGAYGKSPPPARGRVFDSFRLTADDWGLSAGVNEAILRLAEAGVVRRVAIMSDASFAAHGLDRLRRVPGIELGLHFNLSHGGPSPFQLAWAWLMPWNRARLAAQAIERFRAQADRLRDLGVEAAFMNGHHHVHMIPGVLNAIGPELKARGLRDVRFSYDPKLWFTGRFPINVMALFTRASFVKWNLRGLPFVYPSDRDFRTSVRLLERMQGRAAGAEVICHPALNDDVAALDPPDAYVRGRVLEYNALLGLSVWLGGAGAPGPAVKQH